MQNWTLEQQAVIDRAVGSTVVIAAPGSGKTSVLTEYIATVMQRDKIAPGHIMAITFTRQAAEHMRGKLRAHANVSFRAAEALRVGTFHAQMFRALLGINANIPVLLNGHEQFLLMRQAIHACVSSRQTVSHRLVTGYLTKYARLVGTQTAADTVLARKIYQRYWHLKRSANRWDYEDILLQTTESLQSGVQLSYLRELDYLLVDEFQDTNTLQWLLLLNLHEQYKLPVFVVGDDDQSIYGFRGASPAYLQNAGQALCAAQTFLLTHNFRSDKKLVEHAHLLIGHARIRIDKPLQAVSKKAGFVQVFSIADESAEAVAVSRILHEVLSLKPNISVGVLARTRNQLYRVWISFSRGSTSADHNRNLVQFRTFHDSKGKEWDVVILLDLIDSAERLHSDLVSVEEHDEERRLYYVAMTRAKFVLLGFVPNELGGRLACPTSFLQEADLMIRKWETLGKTVVLDAISHLDV